MTQQPHIASLSTRLSFILFVLAVVVYVVSSISHEFGVSIVGKNDLINGFNVFDNEPNYGALSAHTTDINGTTGAAHDTASNFTKLHPGFALNNDITFDSTALLSVATAALVATMRIENENIFDPGRLWPHTTQSPHPTHQLALVLNNVDDGRLKFDVLGYAHDVIFDRIGFDWDEYAIFEYYFNEKFCSTWVFCFLKNFSVVYA